MEQFSLLRLRAPLTTEDVKRETREVDPADQLNAWCGVQQGTTRWHELRACRVTASNFGSVHRTNTYCSPADLLRNILWPSSMDSVAMRYGSLNEKGAFFRFSEWLTEHADRPDPPFSSTSPGSGCLLSIHSWRGLRTVCCMKRWMHAPSRTAVACTTVADDPWWRSKHPGSCETEWLGPSSIHPVTSATVGRTAYLVRITIRSRATRTSWGWALCTSSYCPPQDSMSSWNHMTRCTLPNRCYPACLTSGTNRCCLPSRSVTSWAKITFPSDGSLHSHENGPLPIRVNKLPIFFSL